MPIPLLIAAALWYLAITSLLMVIQYFIEQHYGRGFTSDRPEGTTGTSSHKTGRQSAINSSHTTKNDPFIEVTP